MFPFTPLGVGSSRGNFVLSSTRCVCGGGEWVRETCVGCPEQRYATREPGNVQGPDRVGIVEGSCGYRGQYSGKFHFI